MARGSKLSKRLRELDSKPTSGGTPMPGQRKEDDKPIDGVVFAMMNLIILAGLVIGAVIFGTRSIESGLEERISTTLKNNGVTEVEVRATARDVLVVGEVPSEELIDSVIDYVANVPGVLTYEANLRVRVEVDPGEIEIESDPINLAWTATGAVVTGNVSSQDYLDAFLLSLEDTFGSVDATALTIKEGINDENDWFSAFVMLTESMRERTEVGTIFVSPDDNLIQVAAEFETRSQRADARQDAQDIVAATTFEFTSALTYEDAPPPPREEQVIELQTSIDELIEGKVVEFETNSDVITPTGTALLEEILVALRQFPDVSIEIAGHTDDQGGDELNLDLSRRRADAVLAYLVNAGESPDRFVVVGYGETRPIADNATADGRARNRRIEFKALLEA
ncbi:MAG: OmpA family protein [Acidimicrobiia bacterium]|nr:OmpA family protein [Acidimicrobiia bacterium]